MQCKWLNLSLNPLSDGIAHTLKYSPYSPPIGLHAAAQQRVDCALIVGDKLVHLLISAPRAAISGERPLHHSHD